MSKHVNTGRYVDWRLEKCVQDCDDSSGGDTCGGIVTSANVELFDSVDGCCSAKLSWIESYICEADSMNTDYSLVGSNDWYVDHRLGLCVQDCTGSAPCGGLAKNYDKLYSSSSQCCSEKLWWLERNKCKLT